jgi:hypothetical protein
MESFILFFAPIKMFDFWSLFIGIIIGIFIGWGLVWLIRRYRHRNDGIPYNIKPRSQQVLSKEEMDKRMGLINDAYTGLQKK